MDTRECGEKPVYISDNISLIAVVFAGFQHGCEQERNNLSELALSNLNSKLNKPEM